MRVIFVLNIQSKNKDVAECEIMADVESSQNLNVLLRVAWKSEMLEFGSTSPHPLWRHDAGGYTKQFVACDKLPRVTGP